MVAAGSKGIGLAAAKALVAEGCRVSICARGEETLAKACGEIGGGVRGMVADVTKAEDLERWMAATVSELGAPEIVVTNTGGPPAGTLDTMTDEQWALGFESTLMNVVRLVRLAAPGMAERGWGRIVHVTSLVALEPNAILPISSTLRMGLRALTRLQSDLYAPQGLTVNAVLPGHTLTDRQIHLAELRSERERITVEQALERQGAAVPVGRLATAAEIGDAIAFLASERAAYISGVSLVVDGGLTRMG